MTQLSVSMPRALQDWIDTRLAGGDYADAADYLRDLVRRDRATEDRRPEDILDEIITEYPELRD